MPIRLPMLVYNLGPAGDRLDQADAAEREVNALLHDRPALLGLSEAIGYTLPRVKGYVLLRDTTRPGRANVAAYVRADLPLSKVTWRDCEVTWPRTEHPGVHPARSWLEFRLAGVQVLLGHQPPVLPRSIPEHDFLTRLGQEEGISLLTRRMAPWLSSRWLRFNPVARKVAKARVRVALADWNRRPGLRGWGPTLLAERIGGRVVGTRIDCAVVRGAQAEQVCYVGQPAGVRLMSDHFEAFSFLLVAP